MRLRDDLAVHNERVKLLAGFSNALGIGLVGFAVLRPLTDDAVPVTLLTVVWGIIGLALHGAAHYILSMIRKEKADDTV